MANGPIVSQHAAALLGLTRVLSLIGRITFGPKYILSIKRDGYIVIHVKMYATNHCYMKLAGESN